MRQTFLFGVLVVLFYDLFRLIFHATGWHWHTSWNIPGFILLIGSMPWSLPATDNILELTRTFGYFFRDVIAISSVSIGFGINLVLVELLYKKAKQIIRCKFQNKN